MIKRDNNKNAIKKINDVYAIEGKIKVLDRFTSQFQLEGKLPNSHHTRKSSQDGKC